MENTNENIALRVSFVSIAINIFLSILKFIAGFLGNSVAMLSDAVHSLSDVLSSFVVVIGVKIANKEVDEDHQYGHERLECVAAIILACLLMAVGIGIGIVGIEKIYTKEYTIDHLPTAIALYSALASILIKEAMYWYTYLSAKKINSDILKADAWHHRSDALSSVGSFIGILGAQLGYPILDPLASIIISFFIIKVSYDIFISAINKLTDKACDKETQNKIKNHILEQEDVLAIDDFKTRIFANKIFVDVEISVEGSFSLSTAHTVAEKVHNSIENKFSEVKHCMVHVNPAKCNMSLS